MTTTPRSPATFGIATHEIPIKPPYRLDLTVAALRRTPTNLVDVYTQDGRYLRALDGRTKPVRTAAVILLRGLGRIDVFPATTGGVQANLARFAESG